MKHINRVLSLLLAAVLVLGMIPAPALAVQERHDAPRVVQVNPHYAHLFTEEDILAMLPDPTPGAIRPHADTYLDLESAAQVLCEGMKNRQEFVEVSWYTTTENSSAACYEIMDLAMAHTGDPKGGDSLQWVYGGWGVADRYYTHDNGVYKYTITFQILYYTTAEQEQELDEAVEDLLEELDLDGKTDYEKIYSVYDYITANIRYDYTHLEDPDYLLMYTAYAALVNKTAVCQGYAVLFYRLMLELGIDARVITGWGGGPHAWNIVELDDLYYNVDSTWDEGYPYYWWNYFLNSFWDFLDHERDMEYDTIAFHNEYPLAAESYQQGVEAEMDPYIYAGYANMDYTAIWYLNRNGTLEIGGSGDCVDYGSDEMPYYSYWIDEITGLWVGEDITGLGTNAFRDFYAMDTIIFTGDAPSIASNAFENVTATAYYPGNNATWTDDVKQNYGGNLTWLPDGATHVHSYEAVVTEPTCTEQGFTTYTCECGDSYVTDYTDALGHDMGAWETETEATCTENGLEKRECSRCDHTETQVIEATGHSYEAVVTAPTCTEQGFTTYTCECGDSYVGDYVDALGHDMGAWETETEATCTENGLEKRECSRCDHTETQVIEATGHSYEAVVTAPTCTEQGYTTYTCACGDSYVSDYVDALGHDWDEGVVTIEPTEETEGEILYTCERCFHTKTEVLPELDHTHSYTPVVTTPTCTEQGFTTYTCACGDSYVTDYTDALGHDMGAWETETEATCTENGLEKRECSRCDHTETRVIEATGHSHEAFVTAPTCTEQGFTTYTCECGDSYVGDYVDALGHDYVDSTCTRCGEKYNPFTDVPNEPTCFYRDPVLWAVEQGITTGATADTFNPNGECMRAHVVTFLWRAAGSPEPESNNNPFVDVAEKDFYYKAVLWAVENGITNGVDATHFGPLTYCNRAQVVTFLYRAMGNPEVAATDCPFTDVVAGQWYEAPILWAVENGITNGMGDGTFGINSICNRAQVVTFLYRAYA